jgi:tRNA1(Val) A37 N6-methylase TrmN6
VLNYLEFQMGSGCAFPPFHAKFLADRYLPKDADGIVVDPCAGWGGRLLGTLLINRRHHVQYIGIDPEERNREAYEGLTRRATVYLKKEITGTRDCTIYYQPFEDWIVSSNARKLYGKVDLVITSPPYFAAENYNPDNPNQSANRYDEYRGWRESFYRTLVKGAFALLKPNGHFILNIADVAEAPRLERDARKLAAEEGFVSDGFFKLAMSMTPTARKAGNARHVVQVNGKLFKQEPVFVFKKPSHNQ